MLVTKFDGRKQPFSKEKVIRTCLRMHASLKEARAIADKVESKAYDGITTRRILRMIFFHLKKYRPEIKHQIDLREAISLLRPKPDFERFVQLLLKEIGYEVTPNQILKGKCVEHEIDAVAKKDEEIFLVEVKHHINHHTYTGLDVCLITQARLEDLIDGFKFGLNTMKLKRALIICNTKFSDHAKTYASCKGITLIGWKMPFEHGLEQIVEKNKLYPITFLKGLDLETSERLADSGIILVKQLIEEDINKLKRRTKVSKKKLKILVEKARNALKDK